MKQNYHDKVLQLLTQYMVDAPDASINDCCRALAAKGHPTNKAFVAKMRKEIIRTVRRASDSLREVKGSNPTGAERVEVKDRGIVEIRVPVPPRFAAMVDHDPEQVAADRADAKEREAAREREQKARDDAKAAEWAKEREAEKARAEAEATALRASAEAFLPPVHTLTPSAAPGLPVARRAPRGNAATRALKRQYLNELLDADPGADPVKLMAALKERFGVGIDWAYVYDTCRVAREIHRLPQIPTYHAGERVSSERLSLPEYEALAEERAVGASPEEDLAWLVRQLGDIMRAHGLERASVSAGEAGGSWEFTEKPRAPREAKGEVRF